MPGSPAENARLRRSVRGAMLVLSAIALLYFFDNLRMGLYGSALRPPLVWLATALVWRASTRPERLRVTAHLAIAVAAAYVAGTPFTGLGFQHGGAIFIVCLGPSAALVVRDRSALVWAGVSIVLLVLAAQADYAGWVAPVIGRDPAWIWDDLLDMVVLDLALAALFFLFVRWGEEAARALAASNEALQAENAERRAAEARAVAAAEVRTRFLATMSHEIRTPMNAILGMTELLSTDQLTPGQRADLMVLERSAKSLLGLLDDVLEMTKLDSGELRLEKLAFSPREVLSDVLRLHARAAEATGVELREEVEERVPARVLGDPHRFRQISTNLVSNALKLTAAGRIVAKLGLGEGEMLTLEVSDTGIGMDAATLERLFAPYAQADASIARRFGGSGLGLAISRKLAELLGGSIDVRSKLDEGTAIRVALPFPAAPSEADRARPIAREPSAGPMPRGRVLVVEDDRVNQIVITRMLARLGVEHDLVATGEAAVERAAAGAHGLVLLDYRLPDLDGPEVARRIRAGEPSDRRVPIVALSANALDTDRRTCLEAGMDDYLTKPIDRATLERALGRHLRPVGEQG